MRPIPMAPVAILYLLVASLTAHAAAGDLIYGSFLGGTARDLATAVAVDGDHAYVAGLTASGSFPATTGAFQTSLVGSNDGFLAKVDLTTGTVVWATFVGGHDSFIILPEQITAVATDGNGNVYAVGFTDAGDFPVTSGALQESKAGDYDGFVIKFDGNGNRLWATYLGGAAQDRISDVAVTANGDVVVVGLTTNSVSVVFPTTPGALDETPGHPSVPFTDGFVSRISADGTSLVFSTYLGGTQRDEATCVVVGADDSIYVGGLTGASDFPVTAGAFDESFNGASQNEIDGFVAKLDATGASLVWASFLGGAGEVAIRDLAEHASGVVTVTGTTDLGDLPVTGSVPQPAFMDGDRDGFVARFAVDGASLQWLTYIGGNGSDLPDAIAVDGTSGLTTVAGFTASTDLAIPGQTYDNAASTLGDGFLFRLGAFGDKWIYGTYFGDTQSDSIMDVALDEHGAAVVVGETRSSNLDTSPSAEDGSFNGVSDGFVARLSVPPWRDAGVGKVGTGGLVPSFVGTGSLEPRTPGQLTLTEARPGAFCMLFGGLSANPSAWEGGVLVPVPIQFSFGLFTLGNGSLPLPFPAWPSGLPPGFHLYLQFAIDDPAALFGISSSNALEMTTP